MPTTLSQLLPPVTADEAKAVLLSILQGVGPVQQVGLGAGVVVVSGAPVANYDIVITITASGTPGVAAFSYSLDGGTTLNGPFVTSGTGIYVAAGTGLTFNFGGAFVSGDQYLCQTIWPPFPVTDWESGSAGRTLVEGDAVSLADLAGNNLANIAAGGFVDYAPGTDLNPNAADWLSLLSHELYENDRFAAVATVGLVACSVAASAPNLTVSPGDLVIANGQGSGTGIRSFTNTAGATITAGTTVVLPFMATQLGSAYNVQNNVLTVVKTPKPGLTVNNPSPGTSAVSHTGGGTGAVAVSGTPLGNFSVKVLVTTSGGLGVAQVQVSLDGGTTFASPQVVPAAGGINLYQLDGSSPIGLALQFAGTFTATDTYAFTSYAQWVTTPGQDAEQDAALRARDGNKWSAIGLGGGTVATIDYLCRTTPSGGSEVLKTSSIADVTTPGNLDVTVSGQNGPVSAGALANIATFLQANAGICIKTVVSNATITTIAVVAQVFCPSRQLAGVQAAIAVALQQLAAKTPIGGKVAWVAIDDALFRQAAGVTDVFLTSPAPNTDTQLAPGHDVAFDTTGITYVLT